MEKQIRMFFWGSLMLLIIFLIALMPFWAHATAISKWTRLGGAPLMSPIEDKLGLQEEFPLHKTNIIRGFKMAQPDWSGEEAATAVCSAIMSDDGIEEVSLPIGTKFYWMVFKPRAGVSIMRNVEWAGGHDLGGFLVNCQIGQDMVTFFIAKRCGNLSLLDIKQAPVPKTELAPAPQPPVAPGPQIVEKKIVEVPVEVPVEIPVEVPVPVRQVFSWWVSLPPPPPIIIGGRYFEGHRNREHGRDYWRKREHNRRREHQIQERFDRDRYRKDWGHREKHSQKCPTKSKHCSTDRPNSWPVRR